MYDEFVRRPTDDERAGMAWWNGLSETMRQYWCELSGSSVAANAWAWFKRARPEEAREKFRDA